MGSRSEGVKRWQLKDEGIKRWGLGVKGCRVRSREIKG